ncbi:MAG TPA: ribonuclease P protein component [Candidatus Tumulicola sp.]|jgi:ribonuclease P protein component
MRRFAALRRRADFGRLKRGGRRMTTPSVTIYTTPAAPGDSVSLVGITVSASIGKAVVRNKLRRRIAAIVNELLGPSRVRILIVPRPSAAALTFGELRAELCSLVSR